MSLRDPDTWELTQAEEALRELRARHERLVKAAQALVDLYNHSDALDDPQDSIDALEAALDGEQG